jgi:hypothetical protein
MNICMPVYHENQLKGSHAQDFIVIFPIFLASFNNRQGRYPECLKLLK